MYPITNAQKRIIFSEQKYNEPGMSNIGGSYQINAAFNLARLLKAIVDTVNENRIFNTRYLECSSGKIKQVYEKAEMKEEDVFVFLNSDEFLECRNKFFNTKFNIFEDKLYKFAVHFTGKGGELLVLYHHSIFDAYSIGSFTQKIFDSYNQLANSKAYEFTDYTKYIDFEHQYYLSEKYVSDKHYWLERFEKIDLEYKLSPEVVVAGKIKTQIKTEILEKFEEFLKNGGFNTNIFIITLIAVFMYKTTGNRSGVIGVPFYNRRGKEHLNTLGMFASTVPFVFEIDDNFTLNETYIYVKKQLVRDISHSNFPYNELIQILKVDGKNLFDINFNYYVNNMNYVIENEPVIVKEETPNYLPFGANIIFRRFEKQVTELEIVFNEQEYKKKYVIKTFRNFISFLENVINIGANHKLSDYAIASDKFMNNIKMQEFKKLNNYKGLTSALLINQFHDVVLKNPNKIAIVNNRTTVSYSELFNMVQKKKKEIMELGIEQGDRVAVFGYKETETFVAILSLTELKITYVPIDPDFPQKRIDFILLDSNSKFIFDKNLIIKSKMYKKVDSKSINGILPLYILYTSGTTGVPKGVMISEVGIIRLVNQNNCYDFSTIDTFLQLNSLSFDISALEIWGAFTKGLTLKVIDKFELLDMQAMFQSVSLNDNMRIGSIMSYTLLNELFQYNPLMFKNFKLIITGGEEVKSELIRSIYDTHPQIKLINGYGPTENSVLSTAYPIPRDIQTGRKISIGKSLVGSSVYVVDSNRNICAPGQLGEIVVGGEGVSLGYTTYKSEVFKEKFINEERCYYTGDVGYYDENNNLFIDGRKDLQVKINGQRIELEEIENAIKNVMKTEKLKIIIKVYSRKIVCFYLNTNNIEKNHINKKLSQIIPTVMIPQYYIRIDKVPFNRNGKLDDSKLEEIFEVVVEKEKSLLSGDNIYLDYMAELLKVKIDKKLSFIENGGDSLLAIKFINFLRKRNESLSTSFLLSFHSVETVIENIIQAENDTLVISKTRKNTQLASNIQREIYFDDVYYHQKFKYNSPIIFEISNIINEVDMIRSIEEFIRKNRIINSIFAMREGEIFVEKSPNELNIESIKSYGSDYTKILKEELTDFNIHKSVAAIKLIDIEGVKLLLFDFHHIVFDGVSREIFVNQLKQYLENREFSSDRVDYYDYLASTLASESEYQKNFWKEKIKSLNNISETQLSKQANEGTGYYIGILEKDIVSRIFKAAKSYKVTPNVLLLSVLLLLQTSDTNKEEITIGITLSTRSQNEIRDAIGPFFNTLPFSVYLNKNLNVSNYLEKVSQTFNLISENAEFSFSEIDAMYKAYTGVYAKHLMNWMYVWNKQNSISFSVPNVATFSEYKIDTSVYPKYPLTFLVNEFSDDNLEISIEYNKMYYSKKNIINYFINYQKILNQILDSKELVLSKIWKEK